MDEETASALEALRAEIMANLEVQDIRIDTVENYAEDISNLQQRVEHLETPTS